MFLFTQTTELDSSTNHTKDEANIKKVSIIETLPEKIQIDAENNEDSEDSKNSEDIDSDDSEEMERIKVQNKMLELATELFCSWHELNEREDSRIKSLGSYDVNFFAEEKRVPNLSKADITDRIDHPWGAHVLWSIS